MSRIKDYILGDFRHDEFMKISKLLKNIPRKAKVLDVGCGYGKKIKLLNSLGFSDITGVEINEKVLNANRAKGLNVVSPAEFELLQEKYDLIVMSHIIEHFQYAELKEFMESYLNKLETGGHLLIATPILDSGFYTNFDHVKPYLPDGIKSVFENADAQISFYSKVRLKLANIYFRRSPFTLRFFRSYYLGSPSIFLRFSNFVLLVLFNATGRIFGKTNGWLGLYIKC